MVTAVLLFALVALVVGSALAHGSITILPLTIVECTVATVCAWWCLVMARRRALTVSLAHSGGPAAAFAALIAAQLLPLPAGLVGFLSPGAARLYHTYLPGDGKPDFITLSIAPDATWAALWFVACVWGVFLIAVNALTGKKQVVFMVNVLIIFASAVSFAGIAERYLHGFGPAASSGFGPFPNRNTYAGFVNMVIPLTIGYLFTEMPLQRRLLYGMCLGLMCLGLFVSLSRGGVIVLAVSLGMLALLSRLKGRFDLRAGISLALLVVIFCALLLAPDARAAIGHRLASVFDKATFAAGFGHGYSWSDLLRMWKDFPLTGTGLDTFSRITATYNSMIGPAFVSYAHSDWLQLLTETGGAGLAIVLWWLSRYAAAVVTAWRERHDGFVVNVGWGGIVSACAILTYAVIDFHLHVPAVAVLAAVILGLLYATVGLHEHHRAR